MDDLGSDKQDQLGSVVDLLFCEKAFPTPGIWSRMGMPEWMTFCVSLINPASRTVCPFATDNSLFTLRSEIVGVRVELDEAGSKRLRQ